MNFDRVAAPYCWLETLVFGRRLQRARCAFVRQIGRPQQALIAGEGDGRFLETLRRLQPKLPVVCIDASAKMLGRARARTGAQRVEFIQAALLQATLPRQRYDLVVTHFFLDCFDANTLPRAIEKLAAAATEDATWLIADFHEPVRGWRRWMGRFLIAAMYGFFHLAAGLEARRLIDYAPFLQAQGFCLTNEVISAGGLLRSQCWRRGRTESFPLA